MTRKTNNQSNSKPRKLSDTIIAAIITGIFAVIVTILSILLKPSNPQATPQTASSTPIPATSTLTPIPMGWVTQTITPMKLVFQDTFIDNSMGWIERLQPTENARMKISGYIKDGAYNASYTSKEGGTYFTTSSSKLDGDGRKDFFLTVDFTLEDTCVNNPANFAYVFSLRWLNNGEYYVEIAQNGMLKFGYYDEEFNYRAVNQPEIFNSLKIKKGVPLRFGVLAINDQFSFFSNEEFVVSYKDQDERSVSAPGSLAIGGRIYEPNKSCQFHFNNVELRVP